MLLKDKGDKGEQCCTQMVEIGGQSVEITKKTIKTEEEIF